MIHFMWCSVPVRSGVRSAPAWPRWASRRGPGGLPDGIDWRAADASDPQAANDAAEGAAVIYQCLNAPYDMGGALPPAATRGTERRRKSGCTAGESRER